MVLRLRGGFPAIKFNSMNEPIIIKFGTDAPKWRMINIGLNLEGVCKNKNFEAYRQKVWIPKGFGKFNITKEVYDSKCPICPKVCEDVENMGLYMARCISKGRIKGESEEKRMESEHRQKDGFLTFEDKDETRVEWLYLEMEVVPVWCDWWLQLYFLIAFYQISSENKITQTIYLLKNRPLYKDIVQ